MKIFLFSLAFLLFSCNDNGSTVDNGTENNVPQKSNKWDEMKWDEGMWSKFPISIRRYLS